MTSIRQLSSSPRLIPFCLALGVMAITSANAASVNGVFAIESANISDLFSATFDGAINTNCAGAPDQAECAFFGGQPPAGRAISLTSAPASGASGTLDIEYDDVTGEIFQINVLRINLPDMVLDILGTTFVEVVQGNGAPAADDTLFIEAGVNASPSQTADADESLPGLGPGVFEHDDSPNADAPDFATFNDIVDLCHDGSGTPGSGPLCGLISILTLDGIRYRLIGVANTAGGDAFELQAQTANNSIYKVDFTTALIPVPAAFWLFSSAFGLLLAVSRGPSQSQTKI